MKTLSWLTVVAIALGPIGGLAQEKAPAPAKAAMARTFATPEDAAKALVDAVRANDRKRVLDVVGAKASNWLMTADAIADREESRLFIVAYDRKNAVVKSGEDRAML